MSFFFTPFKLLCAIGLMAIFSSTIAKSPALPLFVSHLGGGPAAIGLIASISAAAGILFSFPAGIIADRFGHKRILLFSALVFATAPFLYLAVTELWQLALVRFYHGLATAIFIPVGLAMIADLFKKGRGEKMGWFSTATMTGRLAAPAMGGAALGFYATSPASGFGAIYLGSGLAGMIVLIASLPLPDRKETAPQPHPEKQPRQQGIRELLGRGDILITCAMEAAILFVYGVFENFLPARAVAAGLSHYQIGICLSSQLVAIALTKPAMGRFSDRHGRPGQIFAGGLAAGLCAVILALAASFPSLLAASILLGLAISVVTSATAAHIADLNKSGAQGSAMGLLGSLMDIGHTLGPLLGGFLAAAFDLPAAFIGAWAVLTLASLIFYLGQVRGKTHKIPA